MLWRVWVSGGGGGGCEFVLPRVNAKYLSSLISTPSLPFTYFYIRPFQRYIHINECGDPSNEFWVFEFKARDVWRITTCLFLIPLLYVCLSSKWWRFYFPTLRKSQCKLIVASWEFKMTVNRLTMFYLNRSLSYLKSLVISQ